MRAAILGVAAAALLSLVGCTEAPPPPAPDTREADAKAIREGEVAWNQDWAAKDLDKIVSHYADDANLEVPEMAIVSGKDAMRATLKGLLMDPNVSLTFATAQVEVAKGGDLAYSRGTYTMTQSDPKTKKPVAEKGKYVTVYRKGTDGSWKAIQDINNADAPAK
jgi:uncharacterized protein (TIGR02246 family)